MNVFYIDEDPEVAAAGHIWHKHTIKMILEYSQLLTAAHRILDGDPQETIKLDKNGKLRAKTIYVLPDEDMELGLGGLTHANHPSAQWVRKSWRHYAWVYECMMALGEIYTLRSGKHHKTIVERAPFLKSLPNNIPNEEFEEPPQCMPEEYQVPGDAVAAYNNYYEYKRKVLR